jgi:ABC-type sugar transport system ATPase subunit
VRDATAALPGPPSSVAAWNISKAYGATRALSGVSVEVRPGSVHALLGENGAGKSTMVKILAGAIGPDEGEIRVRGVPIVLRSPADARRSGISVVHQELSLFPALNVASNIYAGNEPRGPVGQLRRNAMDTAVRRTMADLGWRLPLDVPVGQLSLAEQQMVEIMRAVHFHADLVLLDEPNSALTQAESAVLYDTVRRLRDRGQAFLLVSHRLDEVLAIADYVSILRDGGLVHSAPAASLTIRDCVHHMVGAADTLIARPPPRDRAPGPVRLAIEGLAAGRLEAFSLDVHQGEVVGISGLEGSGITDLFDALFGTRPILAGTMTLDGAAYAPRSPADAIARGVASIPADRRTAGLLPTRSISDNIVLVILDRLRSIGGLLRDSRLAAAARQYSERFRIKAAGLDAGIMTLSGGNQQKVVLGKWLALRPGVLLLNDPTRGIDVGAKAEVHAVVRELADEGVAVLVWSSDADELLSLCDRVIVLREGRQTAELTPATADRRDLALAVAGGGGDER